jgi:hypothetical protein
MNISRKSLLLALAISSSASAFVFPTNHAIAHRQLQAVETAEAEVTSEQQPPEQPIMDIPPPPSVSLAQQQTPNKTKAYTQVKTKPTKPFNPAHKEGILSPLVYAANKIMGKEELNKLRAQIISLHSDIIKSFVDTSDSEFGKAILRQLFQITDADGSGYLDEEEVRRALELLGFKWLEDKHVRKIFERADLNDDGEISLEEFMEEAPKTLRVNLVKLAKNNGGDLGLLV